MGQASKAFDDRAAISASRQPGDGQRRAAALLKAKQDALGPKIEGPPSRQVLRSRQRKADKPQWRRQRAERIANRKAA